MNEWGRGGRGRRIGTCNEEDRGQRTETETETGTGTGTGSNERRWKRGGNMDKFEWIGMYMYIRTYRGYGCLISLGIPLPVLRMYLQKITCKNNYLFNGNKVPLFFTEMNSRIFIARAIARAIIDSRVHRGEKKALYYRWIRHFIFYILVFLFCRHMQMVKVL